VRVKTGNARNMKCLLREVTGRASSRKRPPGCKLQDPKGALSKPVRDHIIPHAQMLVMELQDLMFTLLGFGPPLV
jgi:hypothetical protein